MNSSWAGYNLLSACMLCASSSPSLVSWSEWTANCPANLTSTSTYFPSYAGVTLPSNTSIPCYAGYDPQSWPNGTFNEATASSIAATSNPDLTGAAGSCNSSLASTSSSASTHKTPVGAIVGGVVGGILLLLLLCCCVAFAIRHRRRRTPESSPETANSSWNSVNGSAKNADLVAPRISLSLSDHASKSSPIDSIEEKRPVVTAAPVSVVDGPLQLRPAQAAPSSDSGIVAMAGEHTIGDIGTGAGARGASMGADCGELVSERAEAPPRLLPPPSINPGIVDVVSEHTGSDYGSVISIRDTDTEAATPEAERVGNILAQLYIEDSRSTDVVHDPEPSHAANLLTVSKAEAEKVQALLDSEARMITPSGYGVPRSSSLSVEAKKGLVSADMVKRVVYTYLMDPTAMQTSRMGGLKLDLLFIQDLTGSQQPYIDNVKASINTICSEIRRSDCMKSSRPGDLRVAFIGFRDHPPQDQSFVTRDWDFASDITQIYANLGSLPGAEGGGDGPEAVTAALDRALRMRWRDDCNKVAVLISDAPPHGIGSQGDYWPDGVPGGQNLFLLVIDSGVLNSCTFQFRTLLTWRGKC
ncbi:hypothetical protein AZE42_06218 [Rhizopogon vesiculosus]|uniref:VWFA domain-containing protein n=1 Tax=Rhizopogon vesiculosus TaxID=180088 RepID=A0A1J8PWC6_9AGAM|nr:hypothetical protein AZE42_06218 [Rhizopogon vesiculosus]